MCGGGGGGGVVFWRGAWGGSGSNALDPCLGVTAEAQRRHTIITATKTHHISLESRPWRTRQPSPHTFWYLIFLSLSSRSGAGHTDHRSSCGGASVRRAATGVWLHIRLLPGPHYVSQALRALMPALSTPHSRQRSPAERLRFASYAPAHVQCKLAGNELHGVWREQIHSSRGLTQVGRQHERPCFSR